MNKQQHIRPSLLAAAALASLASLAHAQSNVTLYGRVDLGVQYTDEVAPGGDSLTELFNGGMLPSIWGLRGTEDLGGGLSGFFNLESHFSADTGAGVNLLFRRQANVGLKGAWGAVALGRQYSPAILAHLGTDPRGFKEQFSMLYPYAYNQNLAGGANDLGIFIGNAISYSGSFGPVNVGAAYSLGEQVGDSGAGSTVSLGASFKGPVEVSASYQSIELNSGAGETKQYGLGAALPVGPVKLKALFMNTQSDTGVLVPLVTGPGGVVVTPARSTDVDHWGVGVDYSWASNTTTLAYYQGKDKDVAGDKTKTLVLSNDYAMSKRTTLYAQVAYADADPGSSARTSIIARPAVAGEKTTVLGVGVKHDF